jgi:hypothetical protein
VDAAKTVPDGPARRELLRQRSAGDPALRARVEELLSAETGLIGARAIGDDGALLAPAARIGTLRDPEPHR